MTVKARLITLVAVGAVAVGGCGSSDNSSGSSSTSATTATSTSAAPASGGVTISMKDIAFNPNAVTVKVGQKVTWVDDEPIEHNVTAVSGASFKSDTFGQGKSFSYTPKQPGEIKYVCTLHPGMDGTITVQ